MTNDRTGGSGEVDDEEGDDTRAQIGRAQAFLARSRYLSDRMEKAAKLAQTLADEAQSEPSPEHRDASP